MASWRGSWKRSVFDHARENLMQHCCDSEVDDGLSIFDRTLFQAPRLPFEDTWRDTRDLDYCFQNPDEDEGEKLNLMPMPDGLCVRGDGCRPKR
jgi:hypothetical protein